MEKDIVFYYVKDGEKVKLEIPVHGMLGLLAYGDIGLRAWRKVRQEDKEQRSMHTEIDLTEREEENNDE